MIKHLKSGYWAIYTAAGEKVISVRRSAVAVEIDRAISQRTDNRVSRMLYSSPQALSEFLDERSCEFADISYN